MDKAASRIRLHTAYSDDARIDNKKIVMKAYFEVKSCKHSN